MTEVLATIIPIFWANGLEKVNADVDPENGASMKLLRKFAFRQVGGNRVKVDTGYATYLRMELSNPNGGGEEERDVEDADLGSESKPGDKLSEIRARVA